MKRLAVAGPILVSFLLTSFAARADETAQPPPAAKRIEQGSDPSRAPTIAAAAFATVALGLAATSVYFGVQRMEFQDRAQELVAQSVAASPRNPSNPPLPAGASPGDVCGQPGFPDDLEICRLNRKSGVASQVMWLSAGFSVAAIVPAIGFFILARKSSDSATTAAQAAQAPRIAPILGPSIAGATLSASF